MVFSWWHRLLKRTFSPARRQRRSKSSKLWQRFRPFIEDLEGRLVPSVVRYTGPDGGSWQNPSNWTNDTNQHLVPGRFDSVVLDRPVNIMFAGSDPGVDVFKITQTAGTLTITGGRLNLNNPSTFGGTLRLGGPGANLGIFGDENDHTKPGQVTVDGTLTWDVGAIHGGTVNISQTGILNITGVFGEMDLGQQGEAQAIINNVGHINQTGSANPNGNLVMDNAAINNQTLLDQNGKVLAVGNYTFSGPYDMHVVIAPNGNAPKLMTNTGIVRHTGGGGHAIIGVPLNLLRGSLLDVQAGGYVTFTGGGFGDGDLITVEQGGTLDLTGGQLPNYSGTYTATGAGQIVVNSGLLTANATTFNFAQGMFQWTGGTIQGSGLTNTGFMNLANTNQFLGGNLYNNGTITLNDNPGGNFYLNRGTLYNQTGGLFDIQTDSNVVRLMPLPSFQLIIGVDNPNKDLVTAIYNSGTFQKKPDPQKMNTDNGTSTVNVLFNNSPSGVVDTETGTLNLTGGGTSSGGEFDAAAGAVMDISFSLPRTQGGFDPSLFRGYQNITGTYKGHGGGKVQLTTDRLGVLGADLIFNFDPGLFHWTGGTIDSGVQSFSNQGYITVDATSSTLPPPTLTGTLSNTGTITETGSVSFQLAGGVLNNMGPQTLMNGTVTAGTINFQNSGGISVLQSSTGTVNNYGIISKTDSTASTILAPFNNQVVSQIVDKSGKTISGSTIDVEAGTLTLSGGGNSIGGNFIAAPGGVLDLTGGNTNQNLSGNYTGSGTSAGVGKVTVSNTRDLNTGQIIGAINAGSGAQLVFNFAPGLFQWQGGTINTGVTDLANMGFMTISNADTSTLIGTINNTGTITIASGAAALLLNNGVLNNLAGSPGKPGTVDIQSDGGAFTATGNSMINNAGMFKKSAGASSGINTVFNTPSGTVLAGAGTLAFNSSVTQGGSVLSGGTWEADNGAILTINSAGNIQFNNAIVILSGSTAQFTNLTNLAVNNGTLMLEKGAGFNAGGNFLNAGTLDLGSGKSQDPTVPDTQGSTFTVTAGGTFTQTATANTTIHIGGSSVSGLFGRLVVTGQANLNGLLNIKLDKGITPLVGDQYAIVSSSSLVGTVANPTQAGITGLQPGGNITFNPQITSTSITLGVKTAVVHTVIQLAFVIGLDNQVYGQKLDAAGHVASGYFVIQAAPGFITQVKAIAPGHDANNLPLLFAIGEDNQVYLQKFTAAGDQNGFWFLTRPGAVKSIAVGSDASGNPELFAIGLDDQVYGQKFDANGNSVSNYFLTRAGAVKSLTVGHDALYRPELFVIGLDNQVYGQQFSVNGDSVSGYFQAQVGQVKSIRIGFDSFLNPELFAIGLDDQVYGLHFDANGNPASGYVLVQTGVVKSLAVSHDALNNPELFIIGQDNQVYGLHFNANGNSMGGYFVAKPGQVKSLDVGYYGINNPEVFVTGLNDNLFAFTLNDSGNPNSDYFLTQPGAILALRLTP